MHVYVLLVIWSEFQTMDIIPSLCSGILTFTGMQNQVLLMHAKAF